MTWRILREDSPGAFAPTGDTFEGEFGDLLARLSELQAETGMCHSAEMVSA